MNPKTAKANVEPVRQRTQFSCMAASMAMCLRALDHDVTEDEVNNVMGARPMKGAAWEQALATAQHYGCRATLTMPSTVEQLKAWTDAGVPVMIAWNPEGRPWSHASVVFDVDDDLNVYVADPNIPNPKKTVRVVPEDEFYGKWYEKFPDYLVRRPACAISREVTTEGAQVAPYITRTASMKNAKKGPRDVGKTTEQKREEQNKIRVEAPKPRNEVQRALAERGGQSGAGSHHNRDRDVAKGRSRKPKHKNQEKWAAAVERVARGFVQMAAYSGNPGGKPIYDVEVDHGEHQPLSGGHDIMKRLQDRYRIEQGHPPRDGNPQLTNETATQKHAGGARLDSGLRRQVNADLVRAKLNGNGRFRKPEEAYSKALDVLSTHGIELDEVVSSHMFKQRPGGTLKVDIAFTNDADPFSPTSITNSILYIQFTELRDGVFEAVAYLS